MSISSVHYNAFFKEILKHHSVWTIKDDKGYPAPKGDNGKRSMPFWSSYNRVSKIVSNVTAYNSFTPVEISLNDFINDWLPSLVKDNLNIGINWSGKKAIGYDVEPNNVITRLKSLNIEQVS